MKLIRLLPLFLVFCLCGCGRSPGIAIINIEEIFKSYKKSQDIHKAIEEEKADMENKGQELLNEINVLVKESEILSESAKKEREARIKEKSVSLEAFRQGAMRNLMERTNTEYQKIMIDVRQAAEVVSKRRGIKVILDSSAVAYNKKSLDVTQEVVIELNRRFDKEAGKAQE